MKKILSLICIFAAIVGSSFANSIFTKRYFEIFANVPVDLSNNAMTLEDIFFTGDGKVILDLADFESIPDSGFNISLNSKPAAGFKLDIPKGLVFGASAGADISSTILFSKDFFTLLSSGYETGDELVLKAKKFDADVFAFIQTDLGWNTKKASLVFHPSVFVPLIHAAPDNVSAILQNTEDGKFIVDAYADFSIFTNSDISSDGKFSMETFGTDLSGAAKSSLGFDLGVDYSWDIFSFLTVGAGARIPLKPGKLTKRTSMTYEMHYEVSAADLISKSSADEDSETTEEEISEETTDEESGNKPQFTDTIDLGDDYYRINRPLKFYVNANLHPFGDFLSAYGKLGFTAKHAFEPTFKSEDFLDNFYIDYLLGGRVSLIGMINLDISTERTDQIYAHKAALDLNFRLVEVGAGVSLASSSFLKSFAATGIGVFVNVAVGI